MNVTADSLRPVPAAYGVLIEHGQVLLVRQEDATLWRPPGDLLTRDELPASLLRRRVQQVLGTLPVVGDVLFVEEQHLIDAEGQAWRVAALYYSLSRPDQPTTTRVDTTGTAVEWIALSELRRNMLQFGFEAIRAGEARRR